MGRILSCRILTSPVAERVRREAVGPPFSWAMAGGGVLGVTGSTCVCGFCVASTSCVVLAHAFLHTHSIAVSLTPWREEGGPDGAGSKQPPFLSSVAVSVTAMPQESVMVVCVIQAQLPSGPPRHGLWRGGGVEQVRPIPCLLLYPSTSRPLAGKGQVLQAPQLSLQGLAWKVAL